MINPLWSISSLLQSVTEATLSEEEILIASKYKFKFQQSDILVNAYHIPTYISWNTVSRKYFINAYSQIQIGFHSD